MTKRRPQSCVRARPYHNEPLTNESTLQSDTTLLKYELEKQIRELPNFMSTITPHNHDQCNNMNVSIKRKNELIKINKENGRLATAIIN